jgi:hypothetical protein
VVTEGNASMNDRQDRITLSVKDRDLNAFRAGLSLIPSIGSAIEKLMFGAVDELRWRRFEQTLGEVGAKLELLDSSHRVEDNEDFANFLQDVAPPLSRSTNEDRRRRFRDLILSATQIPSGDARWEEVYTVSRLLDSIGGPGLSVLATVSRCSNRLVYIYSTPTPYIYDGTPDGKPEEYAKLFQDYGKPYHLLGYQWNVIEEWVYRLREMRLVGTQSSDARGGFGGVQLTGLGQLLIRWAVSDRFTPAD